MQIYEVGFKGIIVSLNQLPDLQFDVLLLFSYISDLILRFRAAAVVIYFAARGVVLGGLIPLVTSWK